MATTTNPFLDITQVCIQRKRRQLLIPPPIRLNLVSPYPQYTQNQLNMRRKTEILQDSSNASNSKTNKLTKAELFARMAQGKSRSYSNSILNAISNGTFECVPDSLAATPTSGCDVPGPIQMLQHHPEIPLYNYTGIASATMSASTTNRNNADDIIWSFASKVLVSSLSGVMTGTVGTLYINRSSGSNVYSLDITAPLTIQVSPGVSCTISAVYIYIYYNDLLISTNDPNATLAIASLYDTPMVSFPPYTVEASTGFLLKNTFMGNVSSRVVLYGRPGILYDVKYKAVLATQGTGALVLWSSNGTTPEFNGIQSQNTTTNGVQNISNTPWMSSAKGIYHCKWVNGNYTGPILNLRRSSDNATSDFYMDSTGTIVSTHFGGMETPFSTWIGSNTAYVITWFDQSGLGNHATQTAPSRQPIYSFTNKWIDFYTVANSFFNLPNGTVPYNNDSYTVIVKHKDINNTEMGGWLGSGSDIATSYGYDTNNFRRNGPNYYNYWYGNDFAAGTYASNNIVSFTYDNVASTLTTFVNKINVGTQPKTVARASSADNNVMGKAFEGEYLNGQLYYMFIFDSALSDTDRLTMENL